MVVYEHIDSWILFAKNAFVGHFGNLQSGYEPNELQKAFTT